VTEVIRSGTAAELERLLHEHPTLPHARLGDERAQSRTLLHIVTDWPGNVPEPAAKIQALIAAGADVNARFTGLHTETPLHWAASSDDVEALDALLDAGADIEADGAVIADGTPIADAVAFGQWKAARRLLERGARTNLWQAAALGLVDRVQDELDHTPPPAQDEVDNALWCAAHGGQRTTAELLLDRGADPVWVGHDRLTAAAAAERSGAHELAEWLRAQAGNGPPPLPPR
jgi:ankyrin repeat protein